MVSADLWTSHEYPLGGFQIYFWELLPFAIDVYLSNDSVTLEWTMAHRKCLEQVSAQLSTEVFLVTFT
jgi:hypothetical protein